MTSWKDWNHFIRPNIWAFGIAIFLIGVLASGKYLFGHVIGVIVSILLCASSITLNHYFDYNTDRKSKQLYRFPVASGKISRRFAGWFSFFIIILSIVISYIFLNTNSFYLMLFANFMVIAYSMPPIRIKERPFFETVWNGIGYGWVPYYLALFISNIPLNYFHHILGLIPFLISASGHILLQIRDIEDDKKGKVITTSTKLGLGKMKKVSGTMVFISGIIIIYLTFNNFLNPLAWISILFGVLVVIEHKKMKNDVEKSYRVLQAIYVLGGIFFILSVLRI